MNWLVGLLTGAFGFAFIFAMTTFIMGKTFDIALLYACVAAITMALIFGVMSRTISAEIANATPQQAADVISAKFKVAAIPHNGGIRVTAGANFFWADVFAMPVANGIRLTGPANVVTYIKTELAKR